MAPTRQQLLSMKDKFLESYNAWTVESILSIRSDKCIQRTGPKSFASSYSNAEFAAVLEPALPLFRGTTLTIVDDETIVDVDKRKLFLHVTSRADTDAGPYENDYHFILTVSEGGDALDEVVEWVDSAYTRDFEARMEAKASE